MLFGILVSCNSETEIIKGELYFKLVSLWPNDGSAEKSIDAYLKKIAHSDNPEDKKVFRYFTNLKKYKMLSNPNIRLKIGDDVKEIFLTQEQYQKLKDFKLDDLNARGRKVIVELNIKELDSAILFSDKILHIEEVDGKSPWEK